MCKSKLLAERRRVGDDPQPGTGCGSITARGRHRTQGQVNRGRVEYDARGADSGKIELSLPVRNLSRYRMAQKNQRKAGPRSSFRWVAVSEGASFVTAPLRRSLSSTWPCARPFSPITM